MYTITSGQVRVDVRSENSQVTTVATLGPDDFFGEMSLLTGEPRSASVIAQTETEVVVVHKADFAAVLSADTGIVEALSMALEERMKSTAQQLSVGSGMASVSPAPHSAALINRIRGFFGIRQNIT
jgi:CRP-like cAMP-binding protein